jgi:membrane protease YdiL (CAAX protease family)
MVIKIGSITKKEMNRNQIGGKEFYDKQGIGHNPMSFLLSLIAIFVMLYIGFKYINSGDPLAVAYAQYSFLLAFFGIVGFIAIDIFDDSKVTIVPRKFILTDYINVLIKALIMFIIVALVITITRVTVRFALTDIDFVLYYLFASICEELFFRAFLIGTFIKIRERIELSSGYKFIYNLVAVSISSFAFMFAHFEVYGSDLGLLLSTLFAGYILGLGFIYFEDISANQIAHFGINFVFIATTFGLTAVLVTF